MQHLTTESLFALHEPKQPPNFRRGAQAAAEADEKQPTGKTGERFTEAQDAYLRKLIGERQHNPAAQAIRERLNAWKASPTGLTKAGASKCIDDLLALPADPKAEPKPEPKARTFMPRPNKFKGLCSECNHEVDEGEGLLIGRDDHGDWAVSHKPGECQPSDFPFPFGRYALLDGDVVKFYAALANTSEQDGGLFAQASDELFPITNKAHRDEIIARIAADPKAAAALYGRELKHCGRCGRKLTSEWRKVGIGPVCIKKEW